MNRIPLYSLLLLLPSVLIGDTTPRGDLRIRDPYVVADAETQTYYLYHARSFEDEQGVRRNGVGAYKSKDLQNWSEPIQVFRFPDGFWADYSVWAPEVHLYQGKYYLFVTFSSHDELPTPPKRAQNIKRQSQILVADSPEGPFEPFSLERGHTPEEWMSLDGTLWVDEGVPYMIYCHEWWQIVDGSMELVELKPDLSDVAGEPRTLFYASDAPWAVSLRRVSDDPDALGRHGYITDGCFLYRTKEDKLLMIWSSFGWQRYAIGIAHSQSGTVHGPWVQQEEPLYPADGGHGMIFTTFEGQLMLSFHGPNVRGEERARFFELIDTGYTLKLGAELPFPSE